MLNCAAVSAFLSYFSTAGVVQIQSAHRWLLKSW